MLSIAWQITDHGDLYTPLRAPGVAAYLQAHWRSLNHPPLTIVSSVTGIDYKKILRLMHGSPRRDGQLDRLLPFDCLGLERWTGIPAETWMATQAAVDLQEAREGRRRWYGTGKWQEKTPADPPPMSPLPDPVLVHMA